MTYQMHPQIELGEVYLKVSHLERSIAFYKEAVGFRVLKQDKRKAELTADGQTVLLILEEISNAVTVPPRTASGLYHIAILLPTRKDLGVSLRRLIELGIDVGQGDHLVSEALYISDPDHNGIEIYRDRPRGGWKYDAEGQVAMATDPLDWQAILDEGKGSSWNGLPTGTRMGHVHLHVSDLQKSKKFYVDLLGLAVTIDMSRHGALFISAGGYHHHLGLNVWAGVGVPAPPANAVGIVYYTIVLPDRAELTKLLARLSEAGVAADEQSGAFFIKDPAGVQIKLTVY